MSKDLIFKQYELEVTKIFAELQENLDRSYKDVIAKIKEINNAE